MPNARYVRTTARIFRRKDSPFWWAEYTPPQGGPPIRQSTGCRENGAAREWLAARTLERVRSEAGVPQAKRIELLEALAEYQVIKEPDWSKGWRESVDAFFRRDVIPFFGSHTLVCDITRPQVEMFRAKQIGRPNRNAKKNPKPISAASVNRLMAALATFGEWCAHGERRYLLTNPFAKHAPLAENDVPPVCLEPAELEAFLSKLPEKYRYRDRTYPIRAIITFAVDTGLRKSELARLRWEDIDLQGRHLSVVSAWSRGLTKGRRTREQVLTRRAVAILEALAPPGQRRGPVFGRLGDFRRSLATAAKDAGLERLWFHATRHIWGTRAGAAGATLPELMAGGGWTSPRMVRRYTHADRRRLMALADRIEGAVSPEISVRPAYVGDLPKTGTEKT